MSIAGTSPAGTRTAGVPRVAGTVRSGRAAASVAAMSARLWVRDTTRSLSVGPGVLGVFGAVVFAILAVGSMLMASLMPDFPEGALGPAESADLRMLSAAIVWLVVGLVATVFQLFAPRRTALSDVLVLLPVSHRVTASASQLPVLVVALVVAAPLSAPTVTMLAHGGDRGLSAVIAVAALLAVGLLPLMALVFHLVVPLLQRLRMPPHHALVGGGLVCGVLAVVPPLGALRGVDASWAPYGALAHAAHDGVAPVVYLAGWAVAAVTLFVLLVGMLPRDTQVVPSRLFARFGVPRGAARARAWYELVTLVRAPQYAAVVVFTGIVLLTLLVVWQIARPGMLTLVAAPVFLPFFFASLQSYGHTRATHWLGAHLSARPAGWVLPKALVCLGVAYAVTLPGAAVTAAVGLLDWDAFPVLLVQALPAWAAAMLGGLLLPYSAEQPLSVGLSMGLTGVVYAGTVWLVGEVAVVTPPVPELLLATAVLGGLYAAVGRGTRPEVAHV